MQANLFEDPSNPDQFIDHELVDASIREYPQAFTPPQSEAFFQSLLKEIPWQQETLKIAGRVIAVPRLQCWMGDRGSHYGYSGMRLSPYPWQPPVVDIRQRVQQLSGMTFNSVLVNYYRDGRDSVAWHADDEVELGPAPVIASVSFGVERYFQLKPKRPGSKTRYQLLLRDGSLIIMAGSLQKNWLHQLPKVNGLTAARINLTFRNILRGN